MLATTSILSQVGTGSESNNGATKSVTPTSVERRCENAECNVVKLVSMVPKRKTAQFVTEPSIMEKPMLINGFTTIFQVDGLSAKLSDLKNKSAEQAPRTIYRIMPNTHAHIVNYVVVDTEGESMRKINEGDAATMRKLLDSQRISAEQMLKKLMGVHGTPAHIAQTNSADKPPFLTLNPGPSTKITVTTASPLAKSNASTTTITVGNTPVATPPKPIISNNTKMTPMQMPLRLHPNLKITPINSHASVSKAANPTPIIKPIPLSNLQRKSLVLKKIPNSTEIANSPVAATPAAPTVVPPAMPITNPTITQTVNEKTQFEKMQQELQELRRTVAILAEAQAKGSASATSETEATAAKRTRLA